MPWFWLAPATAMSSASAGVERCDGVDDDGDGAVDEGPVLAAADLDLDGGGSARDAALYVGCESAQGLLPPTDCDDGSERVAPGRSEGCNGVDDDCDGAIDEDACGEPVVVATGRVYLAELDPAAWVAAAAACDALGWTLATPSTDVEQAELFAVVDPYDALFWLGYSDRDDEGDWAWVDGSPVGGSNWDEWQPDDYGGVEDCADCTEDGAWNDLPCEAWLRYVCETDCAIATWYADGDGDGLGDPDVALDACAPDRGWVANGLDCDDADDRAPAVWHQDRDGDGFGGDALVGCAAADRVTDGTDCDDRDGAVHPGADDVPDDAVDQDCDGLDTPADPGDPGGPPDPGDPPGEGDPTGTDASSGGATGAPPSPDYGWTCASVGGTGRVAWVAALIAAPLARRRRLTPRCTSR
ncbi:MAG: lectin-like protein [Myxococcota bacterium]